MRSAISQFHCSQSGLVQNAHLIWLKTLSDGEKRVAGTDMNLRKQDGLRPCRQQERWRDFIEESTRQTSENLEDGTSGTDGAD